MIHYAQASAYYTACGRSSNAGRSMVVRGVIEEPIAQSDDWRHVTCAECILHAQPRLSAQIRETRNAIAALQRKLADLRSQETWVKDRTP